jgi:regulator of sigma E protease
MMLGDADATSVKADTRELGDKEKDKSLHSKTPFQRMMVAFGGPLFNILLTIAILASIGIWKGIPEVVPEIKEMAEGSVAKKCGLQKGDIITGINKHNLSGMSDMKNLLKKYAGQDVTISFKRKGKELTVSVPLYEVDSAGKKQSLSLLGIQSTNNIFFKKATVLQSIGYGTRYCYDMTAATMGGLVRIFSKKKGGGEIGGVFTIGDMAEKSIQQGIVPFAIFIAMISFNLAFFNLLPIPVLDGGSIAINLIEIIIRRPLSVAFINFAYIIGICVVASLMLWSLWNDFIRFSVIEKLIFWFKSLFH